MAHEPFMAALDAWRKAAIAKAEATEAYRVAHAKAWLAPEKATETARKTQADIETSCLRVLRDAAEIKEREAYHLMIFVRGSAGDAEVST